MTCLHLHPVPTSFGFEGKAVVTLYPAPLLPSLLLWAVDTVLSCFPLPFDTRWPNYVIDLIVYGFERERHFQPCLLETLPRHAHVPIYTDKVPYNETMASPAANIARTAPKTTTLTSSHLTAAKALFLRETRSGKG